MFVAGSFILTVAAASQGSRRLSPELSATAQNGGDILPEYCRYRNRGRLSHGHCGPCLPGFIEDDNKVRKDGIVKPCVLPGPPDTVDNEACLPIVNVAGLTSLVSPPEGISGTIGSREAVISQLRRALVGPSAPGFVYITGASALGLTPAIVAAARRDFHAVFDLPYKKKVQMNQKRENRLSEDPGAFQVTEFHHVERYSAAAMEAGPNSESLTVSGLASDVIGNISTLMTTVRHDPSRIMAFWEAVLSLNDKLMQALAQALGLDPSALFNRGNQGNGPRSMSEYNGFLDTIRYWGNGDYEDRGAYLETIDYRVTPHTDITFLTTLVPDPGLRIMCRGRWHEIDLGVLPEGSILVLPGHLLSLITGERVAPALHDVLGPRMSVRHFPNDTARHATARGRRLSITAQFRPQPGWVMESAFPNDIPHFVPRMVVKSANSMVATRLLVPEKEMPEKDIPEPWSLQSLWVAIVIFAAVIIAVLHYITICKCSSACSPNYSPPTLLLLSGKRGAGKDFLAEALLEFLPPGAIDLHRIGLLNKALYAQQHGVDLSRLLHDRDFKNKHRTGLIAHYNKLHDADELFAVRGVASAAISAARRRGSVPVHCVVDLRLAYELTHIRSEASLAGMKVIHVRLESSNSARIRRCCAETDSTDPGLQHATETGLDNKAPDLTLTNDADGAEVVVGRFVPILRKAIGLQATARWSGGLAGSLSVATVLVKPHALTTDGVALVQNKLAQASIRIISEATITGSDTRTKIDRHYIQQSRWAFGAPSSIAPSATSQSAFFSAFGISWHDVLRRNQVINAIDAMRRLAISSSQLALLCTSARATSIKLCGGCYCSRVASNDSIDDVVFVINGHYPAMREEYMHPGAAVHCLTIVWRSEMLDWRKFRDEVIGTTRPADRSAGSLRALFGKNWETLGLAAPPTLLQNCVHASDSAFEGLAERFNWLDADCSNDILGQQLIDVGLTPKQVTMLVDDPLIRGCAADGDSAHLFDLLSGMGANETIDTIAKLNALRQF